jgi:hypothetical protein
MLSPETINALEEALDAVITEAGDDEQYADLVEQLSQAREAASQLGEGEAPGKDEAPEAPEAEAEEEARAEDEQRDPFSFDDAEKAFRAKRKQRKAPADDEGADEEDDA